MINKLNNFLNKFSTHWRSYFYIRNRAAKNEVAKFKDIHKGEIIFVVGAGPSLAQENLKLLEGKIVISIQYAYEAFLNIKLKKHYWLIGAFKRMKNFADNDRRHADATFLCAGITYENLAELIKPGDIILKSKTGFKRFTPDNVSERNAFSFDLEKYIERGGTSSLFMGIQLAAYMGAKKIVLLGADFGIAEGMKSHFTDNVVLNFKSNANDEFWQRKYEGQNKSTLLFYKNTLAERNIPLINATKITREDVLKKQSLEEVILEK